MLARSMVVDALDSRSKSATLLSVTLKLKSPVLLCALALLATRCEMPPEERIPEKVQITVANLNFLHGLGCPTDSDYCRLEDRADLLFDWIAESGCPDVVTLQEIWSTSELLIQAMEVGTCPFEYETIRGGTLLGLDDQMILSRYPIDTDDLIPLYLEFRTLSYARINHPSGVVEVFTTHLASSSDGGDDPCGSGVACPEECIAVGAANVRDCQAVQTALIAEERRDPSGVALVTGDFNDVPESFLYHQFSDRGWVDAYLDAENPECCVITGEGCTSGRDDESLDEMESRELNQSERIDYVFVVPPADRLWGLDPAGDVDGDGIETGLFAGAPNPLAVPCGDEPLPVCWPSDHSGVLVDLWVR